MNLNKNDYHSWIELDQRAFDHNIQELYKMRGPAETLGLVVKANAYGHGLAHVVSMVQRHSFVSHLFVSTLQEALSLYKMRPVQQIVSLVPVERVLIADAIRAGIELVVYSFEFLRVVRDCAELVGLPASIHIKVDTGLGRLGFMPEEIQGLIQFLLESRSFFVFQGCMTHYAESGSADYTRLFLQQKCFAGLVKQFADSGIIFALYHAAASGGYVHMDPSFENFARIGTAWTGIWKSSEQRGDVSEMYPKASLLPVLSWKTRVMQIKQLPIGASVGYMGRFVTVRPTRLLILPVGYYDGFAREFYPGGTILVNGVLAPVAGLISMNIMAVDGTDCGVVEVGDEVVVLGGKEEQGVSFLAAQIGVGELDLFTRLSDSLPRIIV